MTDWLTLPTGVLNALLELIGRLSAEERLDRIGDQAVAAGSVKQNVARERIRKLERQAGGDKARPVDLAELGALGIVVEYQ